jgi:hypothetical protein
MKSQLSFGKRDRMDRPSQRSGPSELFQDESVGYILKDMTMREEFSDESLFGEDKIEELIDKKNSFMRSGGNMGGMGDSFRSKVGKNGMRANEEQLLHFSRQQTPNGSVKDLGKHNEIANLTQR